MTLQLKHFLHPSQPHHLPIPDRNGRMPGRILSRTSVGRARPTNCSARTTCGSSTCWAARHWRAWKGRWPKVTWGDPQCMFDPRNYTLLPHCAHRIEYMYIYIYIFFSGRFVLKWRFPRLISPWSRLPGRTSEVKRSSPSESLTWSPKKWWSSLGLGAD